MLLALLVSGSTHISRKLAVVGISVPLTQQRPDGVGSVSYIGLEETSMRDQW